MKIIVNKEKLSKPLSLINEIAIKNATNDLVKNILLIGKDDSFICKATNFELFYELTIPAVIEEPGELCINAYYFMNLIKEIPYDEIIIESTSNNWMLISAGNSNNKLPGIETSIFPKVEFESLPNPVQILWSDWTKVVDMVHFGIGTNPARKNLMGLNIKKNEAECIRLTGSDAFRMLSSKIQLKEPSDGDIDIIIPKKNLLELKRLPIPEDSYAMFSWNDRIFQIESEFAKMKTSLIAANYPNLEKLLLFEASQKATFKASELANFLKITKIFVEHNHAVKLTFKSSKIIIEGEKSDIGETVQEINCLYDDPEYSVGLNVNFLLEALHVFGDEEVDINLSPSGKPIMFSCKKYPDYHSIIMPIRLQW